MTIEPTNVSEGLERLKKLLAKEGNRPWSAEEIIFIRDHASILLATLSPPLPSRPIAWRWRYVYPDRVGHWTVRQTPIEPLAARAGYAALEVEPLYASLPSPGVERLREALQVIADRPGAGMGYAKCGGEFPIDEVANMANIARAALSALSLDGGLASE